MGIVISSLSYTHPDKDALFSNISYSVLKGRKAALVGNNGTGKSTLLKIIAGRLLPQAGNVAIDGHLYYIPQHLGQYDNYSVAGALGIHAKLQGLHAILNGEASNENLALLEDDWDIEEQLRAALSYWQLDRISPLQSMKTLSGGEKTRVFMAGIMLHRPDVILLDEPTNHLDTTAREQLYDFVTKSNATLLIVSHDRRLLNIPDMVLELTGNGIAHYGGNYDFYETEKQAMQHALEAKLDEKQKMLKQAQQKAKEVSNQRQKLETRGHAAGKSNSLPRIISGGRKTEAEQTTARLNETHASKISEIASGLQEIRERVMQHKPLRIDLGKPGLHANKLLIKAEGINFKYDDELLWHTNLSFEVRLGNKVRITGRNGSGKTTLLKLLTGSLQPVEGSVTVTESGILYLDQQYSIIENSLTVFEQAQKYNSRNLPGHDLKMLLHNHQFSAPMWDKKCYVLSGGERMKLIFCCLYVSLQMPNLILLDEPTNNLDIESQKVLINAVNSFSGALLIISHDEYFVSRIGISQRVSLQ